MANTSKRMSRLLNRVSVHKTAVSIRLPKAMRKTAFKESCKPYHNSETSVETLEKIDRPCL